MAPIDDVKCISENKCFGGFQRVYEFFSVTLNCTTKFAAYIPPKTTDSEKFPVLFFLSGLTSSEQNVITKSGFQRYAAQYKIIVVAPDTSPRNVLPNEDEIWNVGSGASMYVNATQKPWDEHYQMFEFISNEIYNVVQALLPVIDDRVSIAGHSMGGHGALLCALLDPNKYTSVSLFAPACNISKSPTLLPGLTALLGNNIKDLEKWDPTCLVEKYKGPKMEILIHVGTDDEFLEKDLFISNFIAAAEKSNKIKVNFFLEEGYDHGYYFVSTFIGEHIKYHSSKLAFQ